MQTVLAVDLGGTKILIGEVTQDGRILSQKRYVSEVGSQKKAVERIKQTITDYLAEYEIRGELKGIGICVVGRVDTDKGIWQEIHPKLSEPVFLANEISDQFHLPCWITNDVSSATLAEKRLGIGKDTDNFVYINIGTGIAGRIVTNGQVIIGKNFDAGEIGHMVVNMDSDDVCICGRRGCVELYASGLGMYHQAIKNRNKFPSTQLKFATNKVIPFAELVRAYENNDSLAKKVVDQALRAAAALTMNMIKVSDPEAVVFGGGVMSDGWFLDKMVTLLNAETIRFVNKGFTVTALDPQTISLKGAAMLVFDQQKGEKSFA